MGWNFPVLPRPPPLPTVSPRWRSGGDHLGAGYFPHIREIFPFIQVSVKNENREIKRAACSESKMVESTFLYRHKESSRMLHENRDSRHQLWPLREFEFVSSGPGAEILASTSKGLSGQIGIRYSEGCHWNCAQPRWREGLWGRLWVCG